MEVVPVKMDDDKCNAYLNLALSDIMSGDMSSARDYCVKILNKNPENKTVAKLKATLDNLKQPNGRYKKFDSAENVIDFIYEIFNAEVLCKNPKIIEFCKNLVKHYNYEIKKERTISSSKIEAIYSKIQTLNYNNKDKNLDYSYLNEFFSELSQIAHQRSVASNRLMKGYIIFKVFVWLLFAAFIIAALIYSNKNK